MSLSPESIRPIRSLSLAVVACLAAATAASLLDAVVYVAQAGLVPVAISGLMLDGAEFLANVAVVMSQSITAVLLIVWLYIARANAEKATGTTHRRHKAWIALGWFTPFVSFWFPMQIVDDIWIASHPATRDEGPDPWHWHPGRPTIIFTWWISFVLSDLLTVKGLSAYRGSVTRSWADPDPWADPNVLFASGSGLNVIAGIQLIYIVRKITQFQEVRRERHHRQTKLKESGAWLQ